MAYAAVASGAAPCMHACMHARMHCGEQRQLLMHVLQRALMLWHVRLHIAHLSAMREALRGFATLAGRA